MRKAEFGFPGTALRRRLVEAILRGEKTATAGLLVDLERDGEVMAVPGERQVVVDVNEGAVAVIEITEV
ncbi:MAG TPA: ASCH domain-containing protein, partial [Pleomorphomonadaceae bacterium]|nr:ASCH domain-containing protein [Pleomorphomonadaceae bacterium]